MSELIGIPYISLSLDCTERMKMNHSDEYTFVVLIVFAGRVQLVSINESQSGVVLGDGHTSDTIR